MSKHRKGCWCDACTINELRGLLRECEPAVYSQHMVAIGTRIAKPTTLLARVRAALSENTRPREQSAQPDSWLAREARQIGLGAPDQPSVLAWCAKCQARHELGGDCACQHTAYTPVSGGWKCLFCGHFRNTPNFVNADPTPAPQPPVRRPVELDDIVAHALGCRHWFAEPCSCGAADPTPSPQPSGVLAAHCIEAACRDALRYRWLRHEDCTIEYDSYWRETLNSKSPPTALDDAIDVMMNADPTTGAT